MTIPSLDIDPFSQAFLDDPFPAHAALRDEGDPVRRYNNTLRGLSSLPVRIRG